MLPPDEYFLVFELITASPKVATIQPLVDILENDENSTGEKIRKIFQNFNFFWKIMKTYFFRSPSRERRRAKYRDRSRGSRSGSRDRRRSRSRGDRYR